MFTGIISDVGRVQARKGGRLAIACGYEKTSLDIGASIACSGCCLTVTQIESIGTDSVFWADVSNETLGHTSLGQWELGQRVNLERALTPSDEMGGHIVQGHVDGVAKIIESEPDGDSVRFLIECPADLALYIAPKGSVALDGVSLTVNDVEGARFGVNIIPHTLAFTTWGERQPGEGVNLEVDLVARYVARISEVGSLR